MAPTKKQRQIFEALLYLRGKGEIPTVREVGALVGLNSPATVMKHLKALEREGLITLSGKSRGIRICTPEEAPAGTILSGRGILVAGRIAAGRPIEAIADERTTEEVGGTAFPELAIDPGLFAGSGELMALRVSGDSMVEAGILDGDFVIIRRQATVEEGEIAAVEVDGEVTLKRWRGPNLAVESGEPSVRLIPANARFEPIEITASQNKDVRVLGKYVGLVRGEIRLV